jgi:hypothetical protein
MRTGPRLRQARALVPQILEEHAGSLPAGAAGLAVTEAEVTSTGMAVLMVSGLGEGEPGRLVIKFALTAQAESGLARERDVLLALHADERLSGFRELIPRSLAQGRAGRLTYRVDSALEGSPPRGGAGSEASLGRWQRAAAEAIHVLHSTTAGPVALDDGRADRWVDAPLRVLWPRRPRSGWLRSRVEYLRHELHRAIAGRRLRTGWVHGDFWLGNLLVSTPAGVRGIVDWDAASCGELAVRDVMHLLLYTRRMATGQQLGRIVGDLLQGEPWSDEERRLLERYASWCHEGALSDRHALLLCWLRQAASHSRQQRRRDLRYRLWETRNVHRVLAAL